MIDKTNSSADQGSEVDELLQKKEFGSGLRIAREQAGLTVSDIAEKILVSVEIIKAIENSQVDSLPALTFTQGYIRSYARLFDIPADDIVKNYIKVAPGSNQALAANTVLPVQKSSGDFYIKFFSIGFAVFAVSILFLWLYQTDFKESTDVDVTSSEPTLVQLPDKADHNAESLSEETGADASNISEELKNSSLTTDSVVIENKNIEADKPIEIKTSEKETDVIAANDEILLTAMADSWCEIKDADGQRLYYQLLKKDEEIKLKGKAPFSVFLGNAPEVRVEVNNKIVDFESLINRKSNVVNISINSDATTGLSSR